MQADTITFIFPGLYIRGTKAVGVDFLIPRESHLIHLILNRLL